MIYRNKISLTTKFLSYVIFIILVLLSYLTYLSIKQQYIQNEQIKYEIFSEALIANKAFFDFIKHTEIIVGSISQEIIKNPQDKIYIKNTLSSFHNIYSGKLDNALSISMFSWVDKDQKLKVNSEFGILKSEKDMSDRDYLASIIKNPDHLLMGKPVLGAVSEQYIMPAGMAIVDGKGNYQGSIIMGFNIEKIYKKILENRISKDFEIQILFDKNQEVVKQGFKIDKKHSDKIDLKNNEVQILSNLVLFSGQPLIVYKKIENQPYGVLLKLNNPGLLHFKFYNNYIFEFSILLLVITSLMYLIRKDFIKPVVILANVARSVSAGHKDISVPTSNVKEINDLSHAIADLRDSFGNQVVAAEKNSKENLSKSAFLSSISHELRSSVAGIATATEFMLLCKLSEEERIEALKTIQNYCEEHNKFIKDLLDVGQAESGNFSLGNLSDEDVEELINRSLKIVMGRAIKSSIRFVVNIEKDLPKLKCDPRRVKQILVNLLTNAVKYSNPRTVTTISAKLALDDQGRKRIILSVKDQGFGMSEQDIKKALNRYETIDNPNKGKVDSFGLGLPLIKHLVEIHGASLEIHSKEGEGSEFVISFLA